jgi:hypothetical protein
LKIVQGLGYGRRRAPHEVVGLVVACAVAQQLLDQRDVDGPRSKVQNRRVLHAKRGESPRGGTAEYS